MDQDQRQEAEGHGPIRTGCMYVPSDNAKDSITVDNTRKRRWKIELSWNCNKQAVSCMSIETIWFQSFQSTWSISWIILSKGSHQHVCYKITSIVSCIVMKTRHGFSLLGLQCWIGLACRWDLQRKSWRKALIFMAINFKQSTVAVK